MSRARAPQRRAAPRPPARAPSQQGIGWHADVWVPPLLAVLVHRRVLGLFFSPDDLVQLARTRGVLEQPPFLWRLLSLRAWDALAFGAVGDRAPVHHAIALLLHAANAVMVSRWARRLGADGATAMLAGTLFGVTALATTTVSQVSTMSEMLALAFSLLALAAFDSKRPAFPGAAAAAHVAALLSKENVALLPLACLAAAPAACDKARLLRSVAVALGLSFAMWLYVYVALMRPASGLLRGEAYAWGVGPHVLTNLLTYARWSFDVFQLAPGTVSSLAAGWLPAVGLAALVAWAMGSHSRPARAGLAFWLLALVTVLPLRHQLYEHYDYVGCAGFAIALAAAAVALAQRASRLAGPAAARSALAGRAVAVALALLAAAASERALAARWSVRIPQLGLPFDSMLRKMEMARNVHRDLAASLPTDATRLVILAPPGTRSIYSVRSGERVEEAPEGSAHYDMLGAVLMHGAAVRALFPQLQDVRLDEHVRAADTAAVLAANRVDGSLTILGRGPAAHVALARYWASVGFGEQARQELQEAAALFPGAPEFRPGAPAPGDAP